MRDRKEEEEDRILEMKREKVCGSCRHPHAKRRGPYGQSFVLYHCEDCGKMFVAERNA